MILAYHWFLGGVKSTCYTIPVSYRDVPGINTRLYNLPYPSTLHHTCTAQPSKCPPIPLVPHTNLPSGHRDQYRCVFCWGPSAFLVHYPCHNLVQPIPVSLHSVLNTINVSLCNSVNWKVYNVSYQPLPHSYQGSTSHVRWYLGEINEWMNEADTFGWLNWMIFWPVLLYHFEAVNWVITSWGPILAAKVFSQLISIAGQKLQT